MKIEEITITVVGPIWPIRQFEIEGVDVKDDRVYGSDKVSVTKKNFKLSDDQVLNVFIEQTAPNGVSYTVEITGKATVNDSLKTLSYTSDPYITKFGKARIDISKQLSEIIQ